MKHLIFFFAVALFAAIGDQAVAQTREKIMHELYFQSVAYPEDFDTSVIFFLVTVEQPQPVLDCLSDLHAVDFEMARANIEICDRAHVSGSPAHWECIKSDQFASMALWTRDVLFAVRGEVGSWLDTDTGSNFFDAKRVAEMVQPGFWVWGVEQTMPLMGDYLHCP